MNERFYARLVDCLGREAVIVASVITSRGATPRKAGSKMLIGALHTEFSVGGGLAEARVIEAARALLRRGELAAPLTIELDGGADAAGVCGGSMQLSLRRWQGESDVARARLIAGQLQAGHRVTLTADELGSADQGEVLEPDDRLLIVGGGHCALALYQAALTLDFDLWLFAESVASFADTAFAAATQLHGDYQQLKRAFATDRRVYVVLLNRSFPNDVATLAVLGQQQAAFIGMMGSQRRIHEVRQALNRQGLPVPELQAPVGIDIDAETPEEIAVSILAQLIQQRHRRTQGE